MSVCYCGACPNCLEAIRRHEDTVIAFENHRRESTKGLHESKERKPEMTTPAINPLDIRAAELIEAAGQANRNLGVIQALKGDPWDANEAVFEAEEALRDYCRGIRPASPVVTASPYEPRKLTPPRKRLPKTRGGYDVGRSDD